MPFEDEKSCQACRVKEIKRLPKFGQICYHEPPAVAQVRSGFERPVISRVIKSCQPICIFRAGVRRQISARRVIAMHKRETSVSLGFDCDLPDASQPRCQPLPKRAFLRERAHFKARAMRNATCSRKSRSVSVNASSFSLSTSINPTTFPDSVITGTTISEFVLPNVGR